MVRKKKYLSHFIKSKQNNDFHCISLYYQYLLIQYLIICTLFSKLEFITKNFFFNSQKLSSPFLTILRLGHNGRYKNNKKPIIDIQIV